MKGNMNHKLSTLKNKLLDEAKRREDFSTNEANMIISNTTAAAYENLDPADRRNINQMRAVLMAKTKLGEKGALEVLALMSEYVKNE